jgi:hypothetical protein
MSASADLMVVSEFSKVMWNLQAHFVLLQTEWRQLSHMVWQCVVWQIITNILQEDGGAMLLWTVSNNLPDYTSYSAADS